MVDGGWSSDEKNLFEFSEMSENKRYDESENENHLLLHNMANLTNPSTISKNRSKKPYYDNKLVPDEEFVPLLPPGPLTNLPCNIKHTIDNRDIRCEFCSRGSI